MSNEYTPLASPKNRYYRFIRITTEYEVSYDLALEKTLSSHLDFLRNQNLNAEVIRRHLVPPCLIRDYTEPPYHEYQIKSFNNGDQLSFPVVETIGLNIRNLRTAANLTQKQLGELIGFKDDAQRRISKWEAGVIIPSIAYVLMLAKTLNCTPNDILNLNNN